MKNQFVLLSICTVVSFFLVACEPEAFTKAKETMSIEKLREFCIEKPEYCDEVEKTIKDIQKWTDVQEYEIFVDARDGEKYNTIMMRDGRVWMAENLRYQGKETKDHSWCPDDKAGNCQKYGRLYDWETARQVCPEGWHLPSEEEWWNLIKEYGGAKIGAGFSKGEPRADSSDGTEAFWNLKTGGYTKFNAQYCGARLRGIIPRRWYFSNVGEGGLYWSSTKVTDKGTYYFKFDESVKRNVNVAKDFGYACRCIKD